MPPASPSRGMVTCRSTSSGGGARVFRQHLDDGRRRVGVRLHVDREDAYEPKPVQRRHVRRAQ